MNARDMVLYAIEARHEAEKYALMGDYESACKWTDEYCLRLKAYFKKIADVGIMEVVNEE